VALISHNLVDIFAVADRILVLRFAVADCIPVLRSGRAAGERRTAETDHDYIVKLIVGAEGIAA
jgi:simple sugar transport system ATP-binding protein